MAPKIFTRGENLEDGHYTVIDEIGVGGMGVVYHCRDELLLRDVAIKFLLPSLVAEKKNIEVFREEARLAAGLDHPNIVTVFDVGVTSKQNKDHHFVAMEYLPGGNLAAKVANGPLPLEHALNWMKQLAGGLSFAHKRGIVHQDIKADNIFITNEGDLKIGDFGLARLMVGRVYMNSSTKGMGTPAYMSPELCRGEPQDHRSDIYSMGILFFELCTGQLPYRAAGMIEMAMKHTNAPVPSAKKLNEHVPEVLDRVIQKMMAKKPEDRYKSMAEVLGIIDDLIFELRVARMGLIPPKLGHTQVGTGSTLGKEIKTPPAPVEQEPKQEPKILPTFVKPVVSPDERKVEERKGEERKRTIGEAAAQSASSKATAPAARAKEKVSTLWAYQTHGPIGWSSAPILSRDQSQLFASSVDGRLYAVDLHSGKLTGTYDAKAPMMTSPILAGEKLMLTSLDGSVHSLDAKSLECIWRYEAGAPIVANPLTQGNSLIVADKKGMVTALDTRLGRKLWSFSAGSAIASAPRLHGDSIYFGTSGGQVYSLNSHTGKSNWKFVADGKILATPLASVDTVYLGTQSGNFFALDAEAGRLIWEYPCQGAIIRAGAIVFTSVFFVSQDRWLYCCEKYDGKLKWKAPLDGPIGGNLETLGTNLIAVSKEGSLQIFDTTNGNMKLRHNFRSPVESQPLLLGHCVYQGFIDGQISCSDVLKELRATSS
jgi:serine/threonine protein kinase